MLTGKRGGYDALLYTIREMEKACNIEPFVIVTDQHTRPDFGYSLNRVLNDTTVGAIISVGEYGSAAVDRNYALSPLYGELAKIFHDHDIRGLLLYGDRLESMIAATVAVTQGIPVYHIQGGEWSGGVDNLYRWAISRLASYHFCATRKAADALIASGEPMSRVEVVGEIKTDRISLRDIDSVAWVTDKPMQKKVVLLQHPDTDFPGETKTTIQAILYALNCMSPRPDINAFYPSTDPGFATIISALERAGVKIHKDVGAATFLGYLRECDFFIGNSSAAVIEAPLLCVPTIIVGTRQRDRIWDDAYTRAVYATPILLNEAIQWACKHTRIQPVCSPYLPGLVCSRIARRLDSMQGIYTPKIYRRKE